MNPDIELSIAKLSAPVEMLDLDRRVCRTLRRANVYTVAEVLLAGEQKLKSIRHIGPLTARCIWEGISSYLGLAMENQAQEAAPSRAVRAVWEASISALALPATTMDLLEQMGCSRIGDLVKERANDYSRFLSLRKQDIGELDQALNRYLAGAAQVYLRSIPKTEQPEPGPVPRPVLILPLPRLTQEAWSVLKCRAMQGMSPANSEAPTGAIGKGQPWWVTRHVHEDMRRNLNALSVFLDYFEEKSILFQKSLGHEPLDLRTLVEHLMPDPAFSELILDENDVERTIVVLRTLARNPSPWFTAEMEPRWPNFLRLSCLAEPALVVYEPVRKLLRERAIAKRDKPYKELARAVLSRTGEPMHWSAIAEQACQLGQRASFVKRSLQSSLSMHRDVFVHLGGGIYALAEGDADISSAHGAGTPAGI